MTMTFQEAARASAARNFRESYNATATVAVSDVHPNNGQDVTERFPNYFGILGGTRIGLEIEITAAPEFKEAGTHDYDLQYAQPVADALESILADKDSSAKKEGRERVLSQLESLFLVVEVDAFFDSSSALGKHLQALTLPRPDHIDRMFILMQRRTADDPVIRGQEHEPLTESEKKSRLYPLFEISFSTSTAPASPAQGAPVSSISEVEVMDSLVAISAETMRACRSAFAGEAEAQMRMALAYAMHGMGLKVDRTRAYAWALIAEGNGAKDGESIRRQMAEPLQVEDIRKGRAWREQLERQIADTAVMPEEKCRAELIAHGLDEDLATELVQDG